MKMRDSSEGPAGQGLGGQGEMLEPQEAVRRLLKDLREWMEKGDELTLRVGSAGFGMTQLAHGDKRHAVFLAMIFARLAVDLFIKDCVANGGDVETAKLAVEVYSAQANHLDIGQAVMTDAVTMADFQKIMDKLKPPTPKGT